MSLFYLGAPHGHWLRTVDVPLFVSRRTLYEYKTLPRATNVWALDSGGFTELDNFHTWTVSPCQYVAEARRFAREVGNMQWAAIQDWMCEEKILKKTGLNVKEHQRRTIVSYLTLRDAAPELPWVPVLQGNTHDDYMRHVDQYALAGVDLPGLPLVGVGSVCRRQHTTGVEWLIRQLASDYRMRLHGFGFKILGLERVDDALISSDSMAWSRAARWESGPLPQCVGKHLKCANCPIYALQWREQLLERLRNPEVPKQGCLFSLDI